MSDQAFGQLPNRHPMRINMDDFPDESPEAIRQRFLQRDSGGNYRVVTHDGTGAIVDVSAPMDERGALTKTENMEAMHLWIDYHTDIRRKRYWPFGKRWDGVDWWNRDSDST